jgi:hypothetical protein
MRHQDGCKNYKILNEQGYWFRMAVKYYLS